MKKQTEKEITNDKGSTMYKMFYVLAILMVLYMGFSIITSYQSFQAYCEAYKVDMGEQWFDGFKSILAATVPCLVYATTLYGIGYLIQNKEK